MKRWLGLCSSLLVALGIHAVILLVPRIAGEGDLVPTIEVDFAFPPAGPGPGTTQPAAMRKGGARLATPPAAPATPVAASAEPAPSREPAAASDPPPADAVPESPAAAEESGAAAGTGPAGSTAAPSSGGSGSEPAAHGFGTAGGTGAQGGEAAGPAGAAGAAAADASAASKPRPRGEILPEYPRVARRAGWQGVVMIGALIDDTGKVVSAEILSSSGHQSLDQAALQAVKRALFDPALRGGRPVSSPVNIPVRFTLN